VAEKSDMSQGAVGKDSEVKHEEAEPMETSTADACEESSETRTAEMSFRHLWTDYSANWKDTRRYPGDGAAAPQHRKLCMSSI